MTLLGAAGPSHSGWERVTRAQRSVFSRFSNGTPVDFELVAADLIGDVAYTVGYERSSFSVEGGPVGPLTLRVTHISVGRTATGSSFTATRTRRVAPCWTAWGQTQPVLQRRRTKPTQSLCQMRVLRAARRKRVRHHTLSTRGTISTVCPTSDPSAPARLHLSMVRRWRLSLRANAAACAA